MTALTAVLSTAVLMSVYFSPAFAQSANIAVRITSPKEGAVVPQRYTVTGDSKNIGTNKILLFIYAPGAKKWFFQDVAKISSGGKWQADVIIGGAGDVGYEFRIVATVMPQVPQGLSEVAFDGFPLPGTLYKSDTISVKRGG